MKTKNSYGIPRSKMPQIKSHNVKHFLKWLKDNHGVQHTKTKVPVMSLKMTQKDFNQEKITSMASRDDDEFLSKIVIMAKDKYILDGHHRVLTLQMKDRSAKMPVYKINVGIEKLLKLAYKYPRTIMQGINEDNYSFKEFLSEDKEPKVTRSQLNSLEKYLDSVWKHLDIDVEFTRHFLDRVNDSRNGRQITIEELKKLFIEVFKKHGKDINKSGNRHKDIGGVLTDMKTDVNTPFFLKWDNNRKEFEMVATTVMRKRKFKPNNPKEKKYVVASEETSFKDFLLNEVLITFNKRAYPKFNNVVILAGGAGSGKGFILSNLLGIEGKVFDVDEMKKLVIASSKLAAKVKSETGEDLKNFDLRNPKNVSRIHEIVGGDLRIDKKFLKSSFRSVAESHPDRKPNLIFDVTLKDLSKLSKLSDRLVDHGYDKKNIHIVWVMNEFNVAVQQNAGRSRVVPDDILLATHEGASLTMKKLLDMGSRLKRYMDGDIHIAFNKVGVDSNLAKSKRGGKYITKSEYITVKRSGKSQISTKQLDKGILNKIRKYVPKTEVF